MLSWEVVVSTVEVARHHSSKVRAHYSFGYPTPTAVVVLVQSLSLWCEEAPDIAVLSPFSPGGFITMYHLALAYRFFDSCDSLFQRLSLYHSMQQLHNLTHRDGQIVYGVQVLFDKEHRHSQCGAQVSYEGDDTHTHSALPYHLAAQVHRGVVPLLAASTPAFE